MGEDEKRPQLYANVCGEWKPVTPIDATPILEAYLPGDPPQWVNAEITICAKLPKYFRCRSKKRLIKLLMANKLSRDEAERMTMQIRSSGLSYREAWRQIWPQLMTF